MYGPAAGEKGGPRPLPAALHTPDFLRLEGWEIYPLLAQYRDPLTVHLYLLLLVQARFADGHFLGSYARLIELMTPPQPERGQRRAAPTYRQVRRAVDDLVSAGLVRRGDQNASQGELRLFIVPRQKTQKLAA